MSTKTVKQMIWFCAAGILGFLVELSIVQVGISMSFGPIWPRFVSLPMAIWVTFLVNKNLSFKTEAKETTIISSVFYRHAFGSCLEFRYLHRSGHIRYHSRFIPCHCCSHFRDMQFCDIALHLFEGRRLR